MDDIVKAALKKWPNVPACRGWLALDARGNWYMRDERVQAAGPFPRIKGSRIDHEKLREFIGRNYLSDEDGAWYFQNGPQRVYVELEAAPWVWRLATEGEATSIESHTGRRATFEAAFLDEDDRLFLATDIGFGIVHSLDMEAASHAVEQGLWPLTHLQFQALPGRFGYRLSPASAETG